MLVIFRTNYILYIAHLFPLTLKHGVASDTEQEYFVPSKVKKWAADDFSKTISWLESQDEKVNYIALVTCQSCDINIVVMFALLLMLCACTMKSLLLFCHIEF